MRYWTLNCSLLVTPNPNGSYWACCCYYFVFMEDTHVFFFLFLIWTIPHTFVFFPIFFPQTIPPTFYKSWFRWFKNAERRSVYLVRDTKKSQKLFLFLLTLLLLSICKIGVVIINVWWLGKRCIWYDKQSRQENNWFLKHTDTWVFMYVCVRVCVIFSYHSIY